MAAPIAGPSAMTLEQAGETGAEGAPDWIDDALTPRIPMKRSDADPLQLTPRTDVLPLSRWPGFDPRDQPSVSVRRLSEGLPMRPGFPGVGLSFEVIEGDPELPQQLRWAGLAEADKGRAGRGKAWRRDPDGADPVAQLRALKAWLSANRVPLAWTAAAATLALAGWLLRRGPQPGPNPPAPGSAESRRTVQADGLRHRGRHRAGRGSGAGRRSAAGERPRSSRAG